MVAVFTGIVEATARVFEKTPSTLTVERSRSFADLKVGSSVAISGVCLTVKKLTKKNMAFDVVEETLKRTTLGDLKNGDWINLERALKASGRFEGHIVLGHVDGVGEVVRVERNPKNPRNMRAAHPSAGAMLRISYPSFLRGLIVEKGSIALDGVSLTIASVTKESFTVVLIPHTLTVTTLGQLTKDDLVNLEVDIVGRYIRAIMRG